MKDFTKIKFLSLPDKGKHKACAKILNEMYCSSLMQKNLKEKEEQYGTYCSWMGLEEIDLKSHKRIADRYHEHMRHVRILTEAHFLPPVTHFDKEAAEPSWPIGVYLDGLRSAHNVGSILRCVEGFGFGTVYLSRNTPGCENKQVQDAARGSHLHVNCIPEIEFDALPKPLVALETVSGAPSIHEFAFPEAFTLAIGNEEYGCSEKTLASADFIVKIPMRGRKNSLNVANAFAAVAAEILRQRMFHA